MTSKIAILVVIVALCGCTTTANTSIKTRDPGGIISSMYVEYKYQILKMDPAKAAAVAQSIIMIDAMNVQRMGEARTNEIYIGSIGMSRDSLIALMGSAIRVERQLGKNGNCDYSDDIAADGSNCGDRAASVRPGGRLGPY